MLSETKKRVTLKKNDHSRKKYMFSEAKKCVTLKKIPAHFLRKNSKWIKVLENTAYAKSPTTTCHAKVCYY